MNKKEQLTNELIRQADKIYFYCVKRCNCINDAEDLSQEILLDILININKGIEINNFDFYIWKICKNHFNRYVKSKINENEKLIYQEELDTPGLYSNSLDKLIESEKVAMLNASIKLLSKDYADILYSYYIDDCSLSFISEKLQLPLGTVKRRLFDIRKKLKEYLKMERLNGKKAFVPTNFVTSMSGGGNCIPHNYTKSLINKNILFHSYDNPCTLEDYSLELGIAISYIKPIVQELLEVTLLKKEGNKYITNFPILTKVNDQSLSQIVIKYSKTYCEKLIRFAEKYFDKFKLIINNYHFTDNELMWVFMFYINRIAEEGSLKKNQNSYRHHVNDSNWNFHMRELYDKGEEYFISENWIGNNDMNFEGVCHPCGRDECNDEIFNTISYKNSTNVYKFYHTSILDCLEYVINNENLKYSMISENNKYKIDSLLNENLIYIKDDYIKYNFILLTKSQYSELNEYLNNDEMNDLKRESNNCIVALKDAIKSILPIYLAEDIEYLAYAYYFTTIRPEVIKAFARKKLIQPNKNKQKFNFNMYIWKLS